MGNTKETTIDGKKVYQLDDASSPNKKVSYTLDSLIDTLIKKGLITVADLG